MFCRTAASCCRETPPGCLAPFLQAAAWGNQRVGGGAALSQRRRPPESAARVPLPASCCCPSSSRCFCSPQLRQWRARRGRSLRRSRLSTCDVLIRIPTQSFLPALVCPRGRTSPSPCPLLSTCLWACDASTCLAAELEQRRLTSSSTALQVPAASLTTEELSGLCRKEADAGRLYALGAEALGKGGSAGGRASQVCFQRAVELMPDRHEVRHASRN